MAKEHLKKNRPTTGNAGGSKAKAQPPPPPETPVVKSEDCDSGEEGALAIDENAQPPAGELIRLAPPSRRKFNDFITDKAQRTKTYFRRRAIPLKRLQELDAMCGTKSFALQINRDLDEAVYSGHRELVDLFLSAGGLKISNVRSLVEECAAAATDSPKDRNANRVSEDRPEAKPAGGGGSSAKDTESTKNQRFTKFRSNLSHILTKLSEIDTICGGQNFVLVINVDKEMATYQGHDELVTQFFTCGLAQSRIGPELNVRPFDTEEVDYNLCNVPHCTVSRSSLGKWRTAAIETYDYPAELPVTLHLCPDSERDQWAAEIDIHPDFKVGDTVW